ncbi:MAG: YcaO-like family protein [archaeon]
MLKKSPKIYKGYKCDSPVNTIRKVENGFRRIGLEIEYAETFSDSLARIYSGRASILGGMIGTNGKGVTALLSKAGAYAELAERCSDLLNNADNARPGASSAGAKRRILSRFRRVGLNSLDKSFDKPAQRGYSIVNERFVTLPRGLIRRLFGSNGLSAGNTMEEAIVHGACELFERHCAIEILRSKAPVPTIDVKSIRNRTILKLIRLLEKKGISVRIKDFTLNNRFPVMGVLFINHNLESTANLLRKDYLSRTLKIASHLDLEIALMRCFTEEFQGKSSIADFKFGKYSEFDDSICSLMREGLFSERYDPENYYPWLRNGRIRSRSLEFLDDDVKTKRFSELKSVRLGDCLEEINRLKDICISNDIDLIVLDNTHRLIGFPAARIVSPELNSFLDYLNQDQAKHYAKEGYSGLAFPKMDIFQISRMAARKSSPGGILEETLVSLKEWLSQYPSALYSRVSQEHWEALLKFSEPINAEELVVASTFESDFSYADVLFWCLLALGHDDDARKVFDSILKSGSGLLYQGCSEKIRDMLSDQFCPPSEKLPRILRICLNNDMLLPFLLLPRHMYAEMIDRTRQAELDLVISYRKRAMKKKLESFLGWSARRDRQSSA